MDEWDDYYSAKKAKLDAQLNIRSPGSTDPQIFTGITVYINGYTNPPEPELREIFTSHGGKYTQFFDSKTTYVIACNLPSAKKELMGGKTLKPEWITDSVKAGKKLDYRKYMLYSLTGENQRTLTQVVDSVTVQNPVPNGDFKHETPESSPSKSSSLSSPESSAADLQQAAGTSHNSPSKTGLRSTADEGFLEDFYNKSRLHLISTMKKETQQLVAEWRRNASTHEFSLLHQYLSDHKETNLEGDVSNNSAPVIFHADIDCFFVAVGRLSRPHLINVPVIVTHSKGTGPGSKSDIACVSYEGRAKGISAGMWVHEAKRLCPEVQVIPYEFEEYRRVSKIFFETVSRLTIEIEPISCDELYVNPSKVLEESGTAPIRLAEFLQKAIKDSAQVKVSIGIGNSKLSARIATRLAKENQEGIRHMTESDLKEYIRTLPVSKLPGVGYSITEKLNELHKIETCEDMQKLGLEELKQSFGQKTGEKLYWLSRGVDNDPIQCDSLHHQAKSVSAGCSFGVRFTADEEMHTFLKQLCTEVCKRATENQCYGKKITLSLWVVKKGYADKETVKPGGHGVVDIHSRTRPFHIHTRDINVIYKMSCELIRSITKSTIPASHIRGIRISLDNLRYEYDMTEKEKKSFQKTITASFLVVRKKQQPTSPKAHDDSESSITEPDGFTPTDTDVQSSPSCSPPPNSSPLPCLNGMNSMKKVKKFLRGAITSKIVPGEKDAETLSSYLHDLINENHLAEGSELMLYVWKLVEEMHEMTNDINRAWTRVFLNMLTKSENLVYEKYGDSLNLELET